MVSLGLASRQRRSRTAPCGDLRIDPEPPGLPEVTGSRPSSALRFVLPGNAPLFGEIPRLTGSGQVIETLRPTGVEQSFLEAHVSSVDRPVPRAPLNIDPRRLVDGTPNVPRGHFRTVIGAATRCVLSTPGVQPDHSGDDEAVRQVLRLRVVRAEPGDRVGQDGGDRKIAEPLPIGRNDVPRRPCR